MQFSPAEPNLLMTLEPQTGLHLSSYIPDTKTTASILSLRNPHLTCFHWAPAERMVAAGTNTGIVHVIECLVVGDAPPQCRAVATLAARTPTRGVCNAVAWSPTSDKIASSWDKETRENGVVVWDINTATQDNGTFSATSDRLVAPVNECYNEFRLAATV